MKAGSLEVVGAEGDTGWFIWAVLIREVEMTVALGDSRGD